jgi:hypothetical protein
MTTRFETLSPVHDRVRRAWRWRVLPALMSRDPDTMLAALVVADASLEAVLLVEGYSGGTAGERLQSASLSFSNYAGLRAARHVRHQAVHRLDYHLCWCAAAAALDIYANALWEHGVDLSGIWYPTDDAVDVWPAPVLLSPHNSMWGKGAQCERGEPAGVARHLAATGATQ